ncbi:DUF2490 domain-containing protein [Cellulophaga baltica]|uniref:DUF2490 domain-containing protein n=1 Tax=Cellulophaga TaxID=104264 RepID=UPI001C07CE85|nr:MULTISPECIES: DUF2490 domain-containing protein [Cellulophaga]MBU2995576.1 DUF2490 domain-containing protein [Cellulophaga baltica]MDO6766970.1 DUF2490 domain-containing protein [Cellulophaga sp. 1_MG-2023]
MITSFTKKTFFIFSLLIITNTLAQNTPTVYVEPVIALNYRVTAGYKHIFSVANRSYIYKDNEQYTKARHIDVAHFSELKIRENQSIALGVLYRFRANFGNSQEDELRITEQYSIKHKPKIVRYGHRLRAEQRLFNSNTAHRFRYRFTLDFPFSGEMVDVGEFYLIAGTEALLSVKEESKPIYDHRFIGNIGMQLTEKTKLHAGIDYRYENYTHDDSHAYLITSSLIFSL